LCVEEKVSRKCWNIIWPWTSSKILSLKKLIRLGPWNFFSPDFFIMIVTTLGPVCHCCCFRLVDTMRDQGKRGWFGAVSLQRPRKWLNFTT
jgi:hypothetical protein